VTFIEPLRSGGEVERDVDEHVLLAADHAAAPGLFEQRAGVDAVTLGSGFGVTRTPGVFGTHLHHAYTEADLLQCEGVVVVVRRIHG
jgi:hypothetical protein